MDMNDVVLNVRIPNSLAEKLAERKRMTLVPTSAFVRQSIERALEPAQAEETQ